MNGLIRGLDEIRLKRDHYALLREAQLLRNRIEEQQEKKRAERPLGDIDTEMVHKISSFIPWSITKFKLLREPNKIVLFYNAFFDE